MSQDHEDTVNIMKRQLMVEHPELPKSQLQSCFEAPNFLDLVQKSPNHNDFIVKVKSKDFEIADSLETLDENNKENVFIKLRAIAITEKLLESIPPQVRKSEDNMTKNLTQQSPATAPHNTPVKQANPSPPQTTNPNPSQKTQALELMNKVLDSPLFNNMDEMMQEEEPECITDINEHIAVIERRVQLLEMQMKTLKKKTTKK